MSSGLESSESKDAQLQVAPQECLACRIIGTGALGGVGVYALNQSRTHAPGSIVGKRIMAGVGIRTFCFFNEFINLYIAYLDSLSFLGRKCYAMVKVTLKMLSPNHPRATVTYMLAHPLSWQSQHSPEKVHDDPQLDPILLSYNPRTQDEMHSRLRDIKPEFRP